MKLDFFLVTTSSSSNLLISDLLTLDNGVSTAWHSLSWFTKIDGCHAKSGSESSVPEDLALGRATYRAPGTLDSYWRVSGFMTMLRLGSPGPTVMAWQRWMEVAHPSLRVNSSFNRKNWQKFWIKLYKLGTCVCWKFNHSDIRKCRFRIWIWIQVKDVNNFAFYTIEKPIRHTDIYSQLDFGNFWQKQRI